MGALDCFATGSTRLVRMISEGETQKKGESGGPGLTSSTVRSDSGAHVHYPCDELAVGDVYRTSLRHFYPRRRQADLRDRAIYVTDPNPIPRVVAIVDMATGSYMAGYGH